MEAAVSNATQNHSTVAQSPMCYRICILITIMGTEAGAVHMADRTRDTPGALINDPHPANGTDVRLRAFFSDSIGGGTRLTAK